MLADEGFELVLDDASQLGVLAAGVEYLSEVFPDDVGGVLVEHLDDDPDADDGVLVEGVALANGDEGVDVDLVDEDVALQDGAHEDGHAAQVLVVLGHQQVLDHPRDALVGVRTHLVLIVGLDVEEEVEGEDVPQVLGRDVALVDFAQPADVQLLAVSELQVVHEVDHLMEVLLAAFVDGPRGREHFLLGDACEGLEVLVDDLLDGLLERLLVMVGCADASEEQVVAVAGLSSLLGPGLLLLLEDAGVDGLEGVLLRDVVDAEVGELRVLVLHLPHGLEVHGRVVDHDLDLRLGLLLLGLRVQLHLLALLEPYLFLVPLGVLGGVGVGLQSLDAVEQIPVPRLVLLEHVLDDLDVLLLLLKLIGSDVLVGLLDPRHADEQQPLDEALEDVEAVDGPQRVVVVDGGLESEEQVG